MSRHLAPPPVRRRADRRLILAAAALAALVLAAAVLLSTCGSPAEEEPEPAPDEVQTPPDPVAEETPPEGQQPQDDFVPDGNVNPLTGLCDGIGSDMLNRRPVAVMVSNSYDSLPQWGISQADILYEMLAEGRITRLLAIFQDPSRIEALASIRSARPYFIDIAQSYGAVYLHFGGSVPAYDAIAERDGLIALDGIRGGWEGSLFLRDPDRRKQIGLEHSVYTDGEKIEAALASLDADLSLDGHPSAFQFGSEHSAKDGSPAGKITVTYSSRNQPWFEYDETSGEYLRFQYGDPHMDAWLDRQVSVKNLFVLRMATRDVPDNSLGLVEVTTTGQGAGYYFCDGKMVDITWEKEAYDAPLTLYSADGEELTAARGKSFVCVVTESADVTVE